METLTIQVTQDHIDRIAKAKKPILGIEELIWNSVDADAKHVTVRLNRSPLGAIDTIEVIDDGLGMTIADARTGFGNLGGSWKQYEKQILAEPGEARSVADEENRTVHMLQPTITKHRGAHYAGPADGNKGREMCGSCHLLCGHGGDYRNMAINPRY